MRGNFPPELIEEIRDRNDIVNLIESYVPLKRQGRNYVALCPFHLEDTPSFSVSPDKQMYYCFGCQKGGGAIDFVMEYEHLSFPEALEKLAQRAGIPLPERELSQKEKQLYDEKSRLWAVNDATADFFRQTLQRGGEAAAYLERRGISAEMQERFRLGYAGPQWEDLKFHLKKAGFSEQDMLRAGVLSSGDSGKSYDRFRNRLMFPICDAKGKVVAFGGRVMDDSLPKYLNSAENPLFNKSRNLYALDLAIPAIRAAGEAVVMEGYLDVITAHQFGVQNAVAPLGTAFTPEQAKTLLRYTQKLVLAYDGDGAGRKAALRSIDIVAELKLRATVVTLPDGCDPDDFLRRYGRAEWDRYCKEAPAAMEYRIRTALCNHDAGRAEGKADIVAELAPSLLAIRDLVERTEYVRQIARALDLDADLLLNDLRRRSGGRNTGASDLGVLTPKADSGLRTAAAYLCRYCIENREAFDRVEADTGWDFLSEPAAVKAIELIRANRATYRWSYSDLLELADEDERPLLLAFAVSGDELLAKNSATMFRDCLARIEKSRLKDELHTIETRINDPAVQADPEELTRLLRKFSAIQQELRKKQ